VVPGEMAMYIGVMGEWSEADPKQVFELLQYGAVNTAPKRRPSIFREALFAIARNRARLGKRDVARDLFDQLLSNDLPDELRARIEKEKAKLRLP